MAWISFFFSLFHFFCHWVWWAVGPPTLPGLNVQHIPCCTGQYDFNLFSQAGSTDPILFGISVSFHCDTLDVSFCVWDGRGRRPCFLACVCVCVCVHEGLVRARVSKKHLDICQERHTGAHGLGHSWENKACQVSGKATLMRNRAAKCVCRCTRPTAQGRVKVQD